MNRRSAYALVGAGLLALCAGGIVFFSRAAVPSEDRTQNAASASAVGSDMTRASRQYDNHGQSSLVPALRANVTALEEQIQSMRAELSNVQSRMGAVPTHAEAGLVTYDDMQRRDRAHGRAIDRALTDLHDHETPDPNWSTEMETQVRQAFATDGVAGNTLEQVDCRATLCRLLVRHADPAAADRLSFISFDPIFAGGGMTARSEDSSVTEMFIFRSGHRDDIDKMFDDLNKDETAYP